MKALSTLFILFLGIYSYGAPLPATSSSMIVNQKKGLFMSTHGFRIHSENTLWEHTGSPFENPNILTIYKSPKTNGGQRAALTVRIDKIDKPRKLKNYINSWKKDYLRFGFNILNSKRIKLNRKSAYLLDLSNTNSNKQLRQLIYMKKKKAVILTCRGEKSNFSTIVKSCNSIFRNFSWM